MHFSVFLSVLSLLTAMPAVHAHMDMSSPPPLLFPTNPFTSSQDADYSYTAPLLASGADFPCKKYHLKATAKEKTPVATWQAGSQQQLTISGSANHGGGSCQICMSEDGGGSFKVVQSVIGNCPQPGPYTMTFTVPKETRSGGVLLAWAWYNRVGNREFYMNCASIQVTGGGSGLTDSTKFPDMFVANVGNGCSTLEGADVKFPNPGPNVINTSTNTAPPQGNCGSSSGSGSSPNQPPAQGSPQLSSGSPSSTQTSPASTQPSASQPPAGSNPPSSTTEPANSQPPANPQPPANSQPPVQTMPAAQPPTYSPPGGSNPQSSTTAPAGSQPPAQTMPAAQSSTYCPSSNNSPPSPTTAPANSQPPVQATQPPSGNPSKVSEVAPVESQPAASQPPAQSSYPTSSGGGGSGCTEGQIVCNSPNSFSMCSGGTMVNMGSTAAGTTCQNGQISKRSAQFVRRYVSFRA